MLPRQAQHQRLARAVDVGIEDTDPGAPGRPGERQVDGHRGFANSALAARHRDDILDAGEGLQVPLHGMRQDGAAELERQRQRDAMLLQMRLQRRLQRMRITQCWKSELDCRPAMSRAQSPACAARRLVPAVCCK